MDERIILKRCVKCNQIKLIAEFPPNRNCKDGTINCCRKCKNKYNKHYRKSLKGYIHNLWYSISSRCNNPNVECFRNYGERGIKNKFGSFDDFYNYIVNDLKIDPRGCIIDRINNNGSYERGNIRFVNRTDSNKNVRGHKNGTSKYKGVSWHRREQRWIAMIGYDYRNIYLGSFDSEVKAAHCYDRAALIYYKEYAYLNFPKRDYEKDNINKSVAC